MLHTQNINFTTLSFSKFTCRMCYWHCDCSSFLRKWCS